MLALQNFLRLGVRWVGPGADKLSSRRVRVVLEHLARKVSSSRPHAGVRLTPADLSDDLYGRRNAQYALADLVKAGVITRERSRIAEGAHEDVARSFVHPALIEESATWNRARAQRRAAGKRRAEMNPDPVEMTIPMTLPIRCNENPSFSIPTFGSPHEIRREEGAGCKKCTQQRAKNAQTGIPHPPNESGPLETGLAAPAQAGTAQQGVSTALTTQPAQAGAWGGVAIPQDAIPHEESPARRQQAQREAFFRKVVSSKGTHQKIDLEAF